jgi:predicted RNase H-like nuclease (RuvC/YqgF family)
MERQRRDMKELVIAMAEQVSSVAEVVKIDAIKDKIILDQEKKIKELQKELADHKQLDLRHELELLMKDIDNADSALCLSGDGNPLKRVLARVSLIRRNLEEHEKNKEKSPNALIRRWHDLTNSKAPAVLPTPAGAAFAGAPASKKALPA